MTIRCSATCDNPWRLSNKAHSRSMKPCCPRLKETICRSLSCSSASILTSIPASSVVAVARVGVGLRTSAPHWPTVPNWTLNSTGCTGFPRSSFGGMSTGSNKGSPTAWGSDCKSRVSGVRHNFVTSRHDRSANAILVTTSRTSPARANRFVKLSLAKHISLRLLSLP